MKIAVNKCYGGFGLSDEAYEWLIQNKGWRSAQIGPDGRSDKSFELWHDDNKEAHSLGAKYYPTDSMYEPEFRTNADVIECIEVLADKANGRFAEIEIIEIPDGIDFEIDEYDGIETIRESHRSW